MSLPLHNPAIVGRSCVVTAASANSGYSAGAPGSNHSSRDDRIRRAASSSRTPGSTVPRSSPITIAEFRRLSSATSPSSSSDG